MYLDVWLAGWLVTDCTNCSFCNEIGIDDEEPSKRFSSLRDDTAYKAVSPMGRLVLVPSARLVGLITGKHVQSGD